MNHYRSLAHAAGALACILILLAGVASVAAQDAGPAIKSASLRLWPEYDDPGLLVIFAGEFADSAGFPRAVTFPLPDGARNVQAAYPDATGGLLVADATVGTNTLTYNQLPTPAFHFEYYVDRQPSGNQREIVHTFQIPSAVESLQVSVQQPARASDFSMTPAAESSETREDGLVHHVFNRANLPAGTPLEIVLRYTKTDSGVSQPQLAVTNAAAPTAAPVPAAPAATGTGVGNWLPWVMIGAGVVALAALLTYWLLSQRQRPAALAAPQKRFAQPKMPRAAGPAPASSTGFCTQCGHPHRPEDRFCAQCGAPRRS